MKLNKIVIGVLLALLAASKVFALPQFLFAQNQNNQPFLFELLDYKVYADKKVIFELPEKAKLCDLFFKNNQLQIVYEKDKLFYQASPNNKQSLPLNLIITNEAGQIASMVIDEADKVHLVGIKNKKEQQLSQLLYCQAPSRETIIIAESFDKIEQPKINLIKTDAANVLLISWQIKYFDRTEYYYTTSLDLGAHFGPVKKIATEESLLSLAYLNNKLQLVAFKDNQLSFYEILAVALPAPEIIFPSEGVKTNANNLSFTFNFTANEPLLYLVTLKNLDTNQIWLLNTTKILPPADLASGNYQISAVVTDGFTTSDSSRLTNFYLDQDKPEISALTHSLSQGQVTFIGRVSEVPSTVTVRDKILPLTGVNSFEASFAITAEKDFFTFEITDEAGNSSVLTREVVYNSASPEVTIVEPRAESWLRPGATMIIEAKVFDLQKDIAPDAPGIVAVNNKVLTDQLSFDQEESLLSGFVTMPKDLLAGPQTITISLTDQKSNTGAASAIIKLDNLAPQIEHDNNQIFTNSTHTIVLTITDLMSGLDASSSTIAISGISPEVTVSQEGERLIFSTDFLLFEGSYEAELAARDNVGNCSQIKNSKLIVDLTKPALTITSTCPAQTQLRKLNIEGIASDQYPGKINIYKNERLAESLPLNSPVFAYNLTLDPGINNIKIEALDKAGNSDSHCFTIQADIKGAGLIEKCLNGPNPFSPQKDLPGAFASEGKGMVFSYALTKPAKVKIMIFDIVGTLIWYKEIDSVTSGVTAWNGIDKFGITAGSGIYPFVFSADSGNEKELQRGKIVIVN